MKKILSFFTLLFFVVHVHAQYGVADIPNPKNQGQAFFVSNPDGILSAETVAQLNAQATALEAKNGVEMVVVVVNSFKGSSDFDFALSLFNQWGIGKKGADNGLLLFVAKKERAYRFISGYGVEGILPDASLKRVGERFLVPNFRAGNYDQGVLEACAFIDEVLQSVEGQKELVQPIAEGNSLLFKDEWSLTNAIIVVYGYFLLYHWIRIVTRGNTGPLKKKVGSLHLFLTIIANLAILFFGLPLLILSFFAMVQIAELQSDIPYYMAFFASIVVGIKYNQGCRRIANSFYDAEQKQNCLNRFSFYTFIPMLFCPIAYYGYFGLWRRRLQNKNRFLPPDQSGSWQRIIRDADKSRINAYLSKGQLLEEAIDSRKYKVWINLENNKVQLQPWDNLFSQFSVCPSCTFRTFEKKLLKVIKLANYVSKGTVEVYGSCYFCNYRQSYGLRDTAKLRATVDFGTTFNSSSKSSSWSKSSSSSKRSSSSRGSSFSGGGYSGGGSSSGGGSFGGGSSGGGGAGGKW